MGRLFGKGSRNDFINFFGSFVRLLTQAPRLLIAVAKPFVTLASQVKDAAATGGPLKALGVAIGGVGILAAKAAVAVLAFATFIGFIGVVAGPVVSILSGVLGILTALASTIVYASGALAAFLPLIIPVAGIIAGIVAAVMDLKGATGELGKTMDEISDKSTRLWERFKSGVGDSKGLHRVLDEVNRALSDMEPLIDATIKGFNRFADQIAQEMQGGAFDKFTDRFARFLPHAMKDLGTIIGNTFGGLAGILRASIPSANTLLDNLVDITDRFDEWANSKKGQQEIKRFLEDAVESAEALGGFIEDAWFFLKRLMIEGKESGDRIFKNMGDDLAKATKFFEDNPDALENWFEHAEETAHQIGDIIDAVIKLADTLDSESSRTEQLYLFKGLSFFIQGLATQIGLVDKAIGGIIFAISGRWVGDLFAAMGAALTSGADSDWWAAVQRWGDGVQDRLEQLGKDIWYVIGGEWVGELWNGITDAFSSLFAGGGGDTLLIRPRFDPSAILEGLRSLPGRVRGLLAPVVNAFGGLAERAARAAGDIRGRIMERFSGLASRVQGEVDRMVARFGNVAERIGRTIGSVWDAISERFTSIAGHVGQAVDAIVQQFVGLAGRILRTIGDIVIRPRVVMPNVSGGGASGKVEQLGGGGTPPGGGQPQDRGVGSRGMAADPAVSLVATGTTAVFPSAVGGKVVDASGWQIITPSEDPRIVATEVVNELIARVV
jgi:methyl-accepting chemotaxis protein